MRDGIRYMICGLLAMTLSILPNKNISAQEKNKSAIFFGNTIQISKWSKYKLLNFQEYAKWELIDSLQFFCVPWSVYEEMIANPNFKNNYSWTIAWTNINARDRDIENYQEVKDEAIKRNLNPDSILFIHKVSHITIIERWWNFEILKKLTVPFYLNLTTYQSGKDTELTVVSVSSTTEASSSFCWWDIDELFKNGVDQEINNEIQKKEIPRIPWLNYNPYKSINTRDFYTFSDWKTRSIAKVRCHDILEWKIYVLTIPQFIENFYKDLHISKEVVDYLNWIKKDIESYEEMINWIASGDVDVNDIIELDSKFLSSYEKTEWSYRPLNKNFDEQAWDVRNDRFCYLNIPKTWSHQFISQSQKNLNYLKAIYIQKCLEFLEKTGFPIEDYKL